MIKELCTKLLDSKMAENENFIRFTFYELRVKNNLSDKDTDEFLRLCMTYLENKGYDLELIDKILLKLIDQKYLDDRIYARSYINNQIMGYGRPLF